MVFFTERSGQKWETLGAEVDPVLMRLTPEQRHRLPPARLPRSAATKKISSREILDASEVAHRYSRSGNGGVFRKAKFDHPVKVALDILADADLIVPGVFLDQPRFLRPGKERYIYNSQGEIIYDKVLKRAMHKAAGKTGGLSHGMKNPDWGKYPDIPTHFEKFPKGHHPTVDEKYERVMVFLELYAEFGHIMAAGKAVGSTFYQLLIWANEDPVLMEQVAIAEATVRMSIRSTATHMAYQGNEKMITLLMKEEAERRKAIKKDGGMSLEVSDEVTEVISITQRAAEKLAARQLEESSAETFVDETPQELQTVEGDTVYVGDSGGVSSAPQSDDGGPTGYH